MGKRLRIFLIALAAVCFAVALYAPVSRFFENKSLDDEMDALRRMKQRAAEEAGPEAGPTFVPDSGAPSVEMLETDQSLYYDGRTVAPSGEGKTAPPTRVSGSAAADAGGLSPAPDAGAAQQGDEIQTSVAYASPAAITDQGLVSTAPLAAGTEAAASAGVEAAPIGTPPLPGAQALPTGGAVPGGTDLPTGTPAVRAADAALATSNPHPETDQGLYERIPAEGEVRGTPPAPSVDSIIGIAPTEELPPVLTGISPAPTPAVAVMEGTPSPTPAVPEGTPTPMSSPTPAVPEGTPSPTPVPTPSPTPFVFDEDNILPEYRELYAQNADLVGWLKVDGTPIDYPVLQSDDEEHYLTRDFFGRRNYNGQLILDANCDPFTPSMNLVISGHNMKSGKMFGRLQYYASSNYGRKHPIIQFDTLFRRGEYKLVAAFYTWDYEARPDGFQYNVNIQYRRQMTAFLQKLDEIRLYDTGVSVEFGDELIMLSTCSYQTGDGRFVVVARRLRPGEST